MDSNILKSTIREAIRFILENDRVISRKYKGKIYKAPASMKGKSWKEKVNMAKAAGASDPEAVAAAATIAIKGKPANKD